MNVGELLTKQKMSVPYVAWYLLNCFLLLGFNVYENCCFKRMVISKASKTGNIMRASLPKPKVLHLSTTRTSGLQQNERGMEMILKSEKELKKSSPTDFQRSVYMALCQVPRGKVTTYQSLAKAIGCKSNQAVGQALRRNPYAPAVPCHRVVKTDRSLGGFGGQRTGSKIDDKIRLLQKEGVSFDSEGRVDEGCLFTTF